MKKTYTVKLTFSGTTVPALNKLQVRQLLANALANWLNTHALNDETQLLVLAKVQVTSEEIDTE